MIYILSAPIRSGKTTSLLHWSAGRKDVYGILTPDKTGFDQEEPGKVKRVFMNIQTLEQFPMEASGDEKVLSVGRFVFSKKGFDKAIKIIRDAIPREGWLIIDEIGPMELKEEGFCEILKEVLLHRKHDLLLVAREGIADQVIDFFKISNPQLIKKMDSIGSG